MQEVPLSVFLLNKRAVGTLHKKRPFVRWLSEKPIPLHHFLLNTKNK